MPSRGRKLNIFEEPMLRYMVKLDDDAEAVRLAIHNLIRENVIESAGVQTVEYGGQQIVANLFEAIASQPERLLKESFRIDIGKYSDLPVKRAVCSYIAGMTDNYASRMYERLFLPKHGSVFERL